MLDLKPVFLKLSMVDERDEGNYEIIDQYILEYIKQFNKIIDGLINGLDLGKEKYEPILRLRYQSKILKGIDPEFLVELRHGDYVYDLSQKMNRLEFYRQYKAQFKILSERLELNI